LDVLFNNCHLNGVFKVSKSQQIEKLRISQSCVIGHEYQEELKGNGYSTIRNAFRWSKVDFLWKLPIPKAGFGVLAALAILLPSFNFFSSNFFLRLNAVLERFGGEPVEPFYLVPSNSHKALFVSLLVLVVTAIIHSAKRPRPDQKNSISQSTLAKDTLDRSSPRTLALVLVLYAFNLSFLLLFYLKNSWGYWMWGG